MRKIISLFQRNYDGDHIVRDEIVPGAEWVLAGEGVATRKWDGTCCMIRDGKLYKRYDAKRGKTPPPGFEPAQEPDPVTGHHPGWLPVGDAPDEKWFREAFARPMAVESQCSLGGFMCSKDDGTYELCGPKINGNSDHFDGHWLVAHGKSFLKDCPRDFLAIREWLIEKDIEGVVWHHPDGRMVKIKKKDFGLSRKPAEMTV